MPRKVEIELYQFDELSKKAKEKARDWYRSCIDISDLEYALEDTYTVLGYLGFQKPGDGVTDIEYFISDGVITNSSIAGSWLAMDFDLRHHEIKEYAPQDETLEKIVEELKAFTARYRKAYVEFEHHRSDGVRYSGPDRVDGYLDHDDSQSTNVAVGVAFLVMCEIIMRWVYDRLQDEWNHLYSNESVDESIRANEYDFTVNGERSTLGE